MWLLYVERANDNCAPMSYFYTHLIFHHFFWKGNQSVKTATKCSKDEYKLSHKQINCIWKKYMWLCGSKSSFAIEMQTFSHITISSYVDRNLKFLFNKSPNSCSDIDFRLILNKKVKKKGSTHWCAPYKYLSTNLNNF